MLVTAADYPFIDVLGSLLIFAVLVGWIWTVVVIFGDLIARRDIRGGIKAGWIIIVLLLPIVGSIVYVVTNHDGMAERALRVSPAAPEQLAYVRAAAGDGGPASLSTGRVASYPAIAAVGEGFVVAWTDQSGQASALQVFRVP